MRPFILAMLAACPVLGACSHPLPAQDPGTHEKSRVQLVTGSDSSPSHFRSETEIQKYLAHLALLKDATRREAEAKRQALWIDEFGEVEEMQVVGASPSALFQPTTVQAIAFDSDDLEAYGVEDVSDIASFSPSLEIDSITNNQERGVDEGDIIKRFGQFLILLRKGRLYSLDVGLEPGDPIRPVDRLNVFPYDYAHEGLVRRTPHRREPTHCAWL